MEFTSSFDQANFMGYCPPPQNDSSHYPNGGWEYHQGMIEYEQSNQMGDASGPQNDQENSWDIAHHLKMILVIILMVARNINKE
ncbi:hypothetical protein AHAS_Ahas14G0134300 [Arachis hypogaea]